MEENFSGYTFVDNDLYCRMPTSGTENTVVNPPLNTKNQELLSSLRNWISRDKHYDWRREHEKYWLNFQKNITAEHNAFQQRFNENAARIAMLILLEHRLDDKQKSLVPANVGGQAGGTKYTCNGIFMKISFKVPNPLKNMTGINVDRFYTSITKEIDGAAAIAKCINRSYLPKDNKYDNVELSDLILPLSTIVEFWGFRAYASMILPLSSETLRYGSDDGGKNFKSDVKVHEKMGKVAHILNLAKHQLRTGDDCYVCGDIECHQVDKFYYVMDTARVLPPLHCLVVDWKNYVFSLLCHQLRPEFLRSLSYDVSSDSLMAFQKDISLNDRCWDASKALLELVSIIGNDLKIKCTTELWSKKAEELCMEEVRSVFRERGVNSCLLFHLYQNIKSPGGGLSEDVQKLLKIILTVMAERALKNKIRMVMREETLERLDISNLTIDKSYSTESINKAIQEKKKGWESKDKFEKDLLPYFAGTSGNCPSKPLDCFIFELAVNRALKSLGIVSNPDGSSHTFPKYAFVKNIFSILIKDDKEIIKSKQVYWKC